MNVSRDAIILTVIEALVAMGDLPHHHEKNYTPVVNPPVSPTLPTAKLHHTLDKYMKSGAWLIKVDQLS